MDIKKLKNYIEKLLKDDPGLTARELMHNLHMSGYSVTGCVYGVVLFFEVSLHELCVMAIEEFSSPLVAKDELKAALTGAGFDAVDVDREIENSYPKEMRYAIKIAGEVTARSNSAYSFGTGDFTLEAWIKPDKNGGTIIARKSAEGGYGYGGYLLVIKSSGVFKLATDDGLGFYEINSEAAETVFDGRYHHILGLRRGKGLELYFDFKKLSASDRTDCHAGLDVSNHMRLTVGFTDQYQEEFNHFNGGLIGEIRIWNIAKTYAGKDEWMNTGAKVAGLVGLWTFRDKTGRDGSAMGNDLEVGEAVFEKMEI